MKTQKEIEQSLIQQFAANQSKVTTFSIGSVIRGILIAVSVSIAEAWNDLVLLRRALFWSTARDTDLDRKAEEEGLTRLGPRTASTILIFQGEFVTGTSTSVGLNFLTDTAQSWTPDEFIDGQWVLIDSLEAEFLITDNTNDTVVIAGTPAAGVYYILPKVPAGTEVRSAVSGVSFTTDNDVIVGLDNVGLEGQSQSIGLGSRTTATCSVEGSTGAAQADTITQLVTPINGILSVTNPVPTSPRTGLDEETDDELRERRKLLFAQLNVDTQAFYEAMAIESNAEVLRVVSKRSPSSAAGVILYVRSRSGADFSAGDLSDMETYIANRSRSFFSIDVQNMVMTDIFVEFECVLQPGATLQQLYVDVADKIADYLDFASWPITQHIVDDDIGEVILTATALKDLDLSSLSVTASKGGSPAGSIDITLADSLPRLARLKITDTETSTVIDLVLSHNALSV